MSLACDRAHSVLRRTLDARVSDNLVLMMADRRLCDRAHLIRSSLEHVRVVGREHRGRGANDGAKSVVELLSLGLLHSGFEGRAGGSFGAVKAGDFRVLIEIVVVIGGRTNDRTLFSLARAVLQCEAGVGGIRSGRPR